MRTYVATLTIACALLVGACTTVPLDVPTADSEAKLFQPAPNRTVLYIYRKSEAVGHALKVHLLVDNVPIGDLVDETFVRIELPIGSHQVRAKVEPLFGSPIDNTVTTGSQVAEIDFVKVELGDSVTNTGGVLQVMSQYDGRASVMECKLARLQLLDQPMDSNRN